MNQLVKNTFILTMITVVAGALLGLVYEVTKAPIAVAQENAKQEAYRNVLSDASDFDTYTEFDETAAMEALEAQGLTGTEVSEVAIGKDASDETIGYVITTVSHEGYGGDIKLSVGITTDGTVKGIEMLSISETAGLGMKAADAEFKDQFKDKQVTWFSYTKSGEKGDDKIDALSGATITTSAVTNAVDAALVYFYHVLGGVVYE
jgi:electron transport complex protein RnfG